MKQILILGSTGTIGKNTLSVISEHPEKYQVKALVGGSDVKTLVEQCKLFQPKFVAINDESKVTELKSALKETDTQVFSGESGILELCDQEYDITVSAIVGFAALKPTLSAMKKSKSIALANKESIVCAGEFMLQEAEKHNCKIIPVDSEHSAIFQIFEKQNFENITNITLTASGGAFRTFTMEQLKSVTPEMATKHPNWKMGPKITVDTATLLNKGLELIEACKLFNLPPEKVEIVVHPESIIHGLVNYSDGTVLANLSYPSMRTPISYALSYPYRQHIEHKNLNLADLGKIHFEHPDYSKFPLAKLAKDVAREGMYAGIALNTSNEIAVDKFLKNQISFLDISSHVTEFVTNLQPQTIRSLDDVFAYNAFVEKTFKYN